MDKSIFIKLLSNLYPKILGAEVSYSLDKRSETEQYIKVDFKTSPKIPITSPTTLDLALDKVDYDLRKYTGVSYRDRPIFILTNTDIEKKLEKEGLIIDPKFQEASDNFALTYKEPFEFQSARTFLGGPKFKLYPKDVSISFDYNDESNIVLFNITIGKIFYNNVELTDKLLQDFIDNSPLKDDEESVDSVRSSILGIIESEISDTWNWPPIVDQWREQVFQPFNNGSSDDDNMYYVLFNDSDFNSDFQKIYLLNDYLKDRGLLQ